MKLLLDQGLPRSAVLHFRNQQIEAVHVGDRGLATASDFANSRRRPPGRYGSCHIGGDFHALLALSGVTGPSVIRIRIEGLRGENLARLLVSVIEICDDDLLKGAMVSVTENGVRIRRLPLFRTPSEGPVIRKN
jgi:predicted nuclease of predicted toxin-antitoxin system